MKSAVVTGVSSGIGRAIAQVLVEANWLVFGSVRGHEDGARLKADLGTRFVPLIFDVTDEEAVQSAAATVRERLGGQRLSALVNNAGVVLAGPLVHQPTAEFRRQLEVNLVGPFVVTKAFAPLLGVESGLEGPPGRIINVSSMAGGFGVPLMGAYSASKHGLEGYSEALRRELAMYGIDVVILTPGSVATPVFKKAENAASRYEGTDYAEPLRRFFGMMEASVGAGDPPERIAQGVLRALNAIKPKVRYAVIWKAMTHWHLPRLLPRRMIDRKMIDWYGLRRSGTAR